MHYRSQPQPDIVVRPSGNKAGRLFILMIFALLLTFLLPAKELWHRALTAEAFTIRNIQVDFEEVSAQSVTWRITGQLYNQLDESRPAPDLDVALQDGQGNIVTHTRVDLRGRPLEAKNQTGFDARLETRPGITLKPVVTVIGPDE